MGTSFLPEITGNIKAKKELSSLDDSIVSEKVKKKLVQDRKLREKISSAKTFKELSRSSQFKEFVKEIRAELRSIYGVFDLDEKNEKKEILNQLKSSNQEHLAQKLLLLHQSSKERIHQYKEIYEKLFEITGQPKSILDLACGYNPYSYDYLGCSPFYTAVDLPSEDLKDISEFFGVKKINGEVLGIDLVRDYDKIGDLTTANPFDVVFLFKALDSLETVKKHVSGSLLDSIHAKWIVVSFPTMSLGGKKHIRKERRAWFEKLLKRRDWYYQTVEVGDEVFYVILKDPERLALEFYEAKGTEMIKHYDSFDMTDRLDRFCSFLSGERVIDVGSGSGRDVEYFLKKGLKPIGVDFSSTLLDSAQHRVPKGSFLIADMRQLPFEDKSVDGIWACAVLVHCYEANAIAALLEFHRILKRGGTLFLGAKLGESELQERYGMKVFMKKWSAEKLLSMLRNSGFAIVDSKLFKKKTFGGKREEYYEVFCKLN